MTVYLEVDEFWTLWRAGQSMVNIAQEAMRSRKWIGEQIRAAGGIVPARRKRTWGQLTLADREEISRGIVAGLSFSSIADSINKSTSTVSREISRNGGKEAYRAVAAEQAAWDRGQRPKPGKLDLNDKLRRLVQDKLENEQWSPEQICAWLREQFPDDPDLWVSHETIYLSLFVQARGTFRKELAKHLRTGRVSRYPRGTRSALKGMGQGQLAEMVHISERPAEAEDRAVPGHWEGDCILGSNNTAMVTLVERTTRFVLLCKIDSLKTADVIPALIKKMSQLPEHLQRSLTWDQGKEMARHVEFTIATDIQVYFCDPGSPWQRGSNENTNGLLRQYFPKRTDLSIYDQDHLDMIADKLNRRPRKTLEWETPAARLEALVAPTP